MYSAKHDNLGVMSYTAGLDAPDPDRLSLLADLRQAVEHDDEIVVYYQPQADLATGRITGVKHSCGGSIRRAA